MSKTVRQSGKFTTTLYGISVNKRLMSAFGHKQNKIDVPGVYDVLEAAENDAKIWTERYGKKHSVVSIDVEYKWKVKSRKPKRKTVEDD
jgi:hypothetical protein